MKLKLTFAVSISLLTVLGAARANTISGRLWHVPEATSLNAIFANVPVATADVQFDVNSPFNFFGSVVSVQTWLNNGSAFNIVENTAGTLASLMDGGTPQHGTIVDFQGFVSVVNGQTFTVTHDDGLQLRIGALLVIDQPGPTAPITQTFTYGGPNGTFPFELVYGECCGGPAVLQISLPLSNTPTVPEGGMTVVLLGMGLAGLLGLTRCTTKK